MVLAMQAEQQSYGAKAVRRVRISAMTCVKVHHPRAFLKKVMDVGSLTMGYLAKKSAPRHLERR